MIGESFQMPSARLLTFAKRHWRMALLQFCLAVAGTSLVLVFPGVVRWFFDDIIPNRRLDQILPIGGLALGAFLIREGLFSIRTRVNAVFEQRMIFDLRSQLHRKIARQPLSWFDSQSTGDVMTRMADDVPATQRVILEGIEQGVTATLQILISAACMFYFNWQLALIVVLPTPFIAAGGWIFARWVEPRAKQEREAASRLNSLLHDTVTGVRQIKSYTAEDMQQREFEKSSSLLRTAKMRLMAAWSVYHPLMSFLGDIGLVTLLGVGAYGCIKGLTTPGELLQFIMLIGLFFEPISRLHGVNQTIVTGLVSARRVFDIIDHPEEEDLDNGCALERPQGDIIFQDVTFGYNPERPVISGINIRVRPHQTVAIVGATGSGKSTLFQLLTRFYDPQSGSISIDDVPITEYSRHSLRQSIGYVTQDAFLFAGNVRDNLLLGKPNATDDELWSALRLSCAEDFVKRQKEGLDAEVGERGMRLSGGERQRLAMARAFLKNAPILLLDEATSAVDTKSEHLIQAALDTLRQNRTCLVIAHRLSTVIAADQIYVMQLGRVQAHGTHDELLASCPYYAELAALAFDGGGAKG